MSWCFDVDLLQVTLAAIEMPPAFDEEDVGLMIGTFRSAGWTMDSESEGWAVKWRKLCNLAIE